MNESKIHYSKLMILLAGVFAVLILSSIIVSAKEISVSGKNNYLDGSIYIPLKNDLILGKPNNGAGHVSDAITLNAGQQSSGTLSFALNFDLSDELNNNMGLTEDDSYLELTFNDLDFPIVTNDGFTYFEVVGI